MNKATTSIFVPLFRHKHAFLLVIYPRVDLLYYVINLCLTLVDIAKSLCKVVINLPSHQRHMSVPVIPVLSNIWYCQSFHLNSSPEYVVVSHCGFSLHFSGD